MNDDQDKKRSMSDRIEALRITVARGLSALKVMIDNAVARIDRVEKKGEDTSDAVNSLRTQIGILEERLNNVKEDVTGTHDLKTAIAQHRGKEEAHKEIEQKETKKETVALEKQKVAAPIYVAIITAGAAFLTGIINLVLHLLGAGGGAGN